MIIILACLLLIPCRFRLIAQKIASMKEFTRQCEKRDKYFLL